MRDYARPQDALLVEALTEHDALDSGSRLPGDYEWYEPIVALRRERITIGAGSRIDSFVKLEGGEGLQIGRNVHIASFVHLNVGGAKLVLGDGVACASGSKIVTGGSMLAGESMSAVAPPEQQVVVRGSCVVLGRNAALLTNAVLVGGGMGEGSVLAAGAVCVHKVIPPWEVWAGVPARRIGWRQGHDPAPHTWERKFPMGDVCVHCGVTFAKHPSGGTQ